MMTSCIVRSWFVILSLDYMSVAAHHVSYEVSLVCVVHKIQIDTRISPVGPAASSPAECATTDDDPSSACKQAKSQHIGMLFRRRHHHLKHLAAATCVCKQELLKPLLHVNGERPQRLAPPSTGEGFPINDLHISKQQLLSAHVALMHADRCGLDALGKSAFLVDFESANSSGEVQQHGIVMVAEHVVHVVVCEQTLWWPVDVLT